MCSRQGNDRGDGGAGETGQQAEVCWGLGLFNSKGAVNNRIEAVRLRSRAAGAGNKPARANARAARAGCSATCPGAAYPAANSALTAARRVGNHTRLHTQECATGFSAKNVS